MEVSDLNAMTDMAYEHCRVRWTANGDSHSGIVVDSLGSGSDQRALVYVMFSRAVVEVPVRHLSKLSPKEIAGIG